MSKGYPAHYCMLAIEQRKTRASEEWKVLPKQVVQLPVHVAHNVDGALRVCSVAED